MFRSTVVCVVVLASLSLTYAIPAKTAFWNGTPIDGMVEEVRSLCIQNTDSASCLKLKIMNFLDTVLQKDKFKVKLSVQF